MAKKKMPGSEKEIKSNVYLIECRSSSHRQPWQFEKRILIKFAEDRETASSNVCPSNFKNKNYRDQNGI